MRILAPLFAGAAVAACSGSPTPPPDDPPADGTTVYLTPAQHLTRASLALRGQRPSIEDLRAVDADPDVLPAIVDGYLDTPEFGETIKELHNETLLLRVEQGFLTFPAIGGLTGASATQINGAVFDEPLRTPGRTTPGSARGGPTAAAPRASCRRRCSTTGTARPASTTTAGGRT